MIPTTTAAVTTAATTAAAAASSSGLVEVTIRAGRTDGFGCRAWPFRIGGAGVGDDLEMAAVLGTAPRSPVAARFACPCTMAGVDDVGFVDDTFWQGLSFSSPRNTRALVFLLTA